VRQENGEMSTQDMAKEGRQPAMPRLMRKKGERWHRRLEKCEGPRTHWENGIRRPWGTCMASPPPGPGRKVGCACIAGSVCSAWCGGGRLGTLLSLSSSPKGRRQEEAAGGCCHP